MVGLGLHSAVNLEGPGGDTYIVDICFRLGSQGPLNF